MGNWCLHASSFIFDQIIRKVAGNQDRHKNSVEFDLGRIRPLILELLALEWRKFHTFELEYLWSQLANLDQILCVASLGWGKGCIRFWGRLTLAHWTQVSDRCPELFILAGNDDIHKSLHEFEIRLDPTTDNRVSCPWASKKIPIDL